MNRIFYIMLAAVLLLSGCSSALKFNRIEADKIGISKIISSHFMYSSDKSIIDDLLNQLNLLTFKKTTDEMDLSAFSVDFSHKGKEVKRFQVDQSGVFMFDGETQCYRVSSGSFDYNHLEKIFEDDIKKAKTKTEFPLMKNRETAQEVIDTELPKENYRAELLAIVNEMVKPTQGKPYLEFSSNPYNYIDAHRDSFNRLVAGGQSTVAVFVDVLESSTEFGLDKYIMAAACAEITGIGNGEDKTWSTAKEWLQLYNERS